MKIDFCIAFLAPSCVCWGEAKIASSSWHCDIHNNLTMCFLCDSVDFHHYNQLPKMDLCLIALVIKWMPLMQDFLSEWRSSALQLAGLLACRHVFLMALHEQEVVSPSRKCFLPVSLHKTSFQSFSTDFTGKFLQLILSDEGQCVLIQQFLEHISHLQEKNYIVVNPLIRKSWIIFRGRLRQLRAPGQIQISRQFWLFINWRDQIQLAP